jgi:hypothetical protein
MWSTILTINRMIVFIFTLRSQECFWISFPFFNYKFRSYDSSSRYARSKYQIPGHAGNDRYYLPSNFAKNPFFSSGNVPRYS